MKPTETWQLATHCLGRRVLVFDRVDSTNTRAAALADDPAHDGTVILAAEQTAGRGQHGRSWQCPPAAGILLSVLLFPPPALRRPALLTAWAAVAVCETVRETTGLESRIKWPNDVYLLGRKVCGILIEQGRGTVVGIGLNVNQSAADLAEAGLTEATSLRAVTGTPLDRPAVARRLVEQLDAEYARLGAGDWAPLEARWQAYVGLQGREVMVEALDRTVRGRLHALALDRIEVEPAGGPMQTFAPEAVRHLRGEA